MSVPKKKRESISSEKKIASYFHPQCNSNMLIELKQKKTKPFRNDDERHTQKKTNERENIKR